MQLLSNLVNITIFSEKFCTVHTCIQYVANVLNLCYSFSYHYLVFNLICMHHYLSRILAATFLYILKTTIVSYTYINNWQSHSNVFKDIPAACQKLPDLITSHLGT